MNILTRSMLWTMWLVSIRQIVYVTYEHVKLYYIIQSAGIIGLSHEYTTADTTNKNMSLFCIDVIATLIKVAEILKTQPVTGILYLSYLASLTLKT